MITFATGCASGGDGSDLPDANGEDADVPPDSGGLADAATDAPSTDASDASADAGYVFDGAVPANAAVIFTEPNLMGEARLVNADVANVGDAFNDTVASLVVPAGYTLYGTIDADFGGGISQPYVGPVQIDDLGALANTFTSFIFRASNQPVATVYRSVGGSPEIWPIGVFPSLGTTSDSIDGLFLPAGVSLFGYDDHFFMGTVRGPYVGPLDVAALPFRDDWSSLVVRASTFADPEVGDVRLYRDSNYAGDVVVLTTGQYPNLNDLPDIGDFNNQLSSLRGRSAIAVFGFEYGNYGGRAYGPYVGDVSTLDPNDEWDSVIVQSVAEPTMVLYMDGNFARAVIRPLVTVAELHDDANDVDGIYVPPGYVVQGFSHAFFGGTTNNAWIHGPGSHVTVHDDWDSFIVRRETDPTVTLYFGNGMGDPRTYPMGTYRDLASIDNQIDGANVPCGVRIRAFEHDDFGGAQYTVTGPATLESVPGDSQWSSMIIEPAACN